MTYHDTSLPSLVNPGWSEAEIRGPESTAKIVPGDSGPRIGVRGDTVVRPMRVRSVMTKPDIS